MSIKEAIKKSAGKVRGNAITNNEEEFRKQLRVEISNQGYSIKEDCPNFPINKGDIHCNVDWYLEVQSNDGKTKKLGVEVYTHFHSLDKEVKSTDKYKVAYDIMKLIALKKKNIIDESYVLLDEQLVDALMETIIVTSAKLHKVNVFKIGITRQMEVNKVIETTAYKLTQSYEICSYFGCDKKAEISSIYCIKHKDFDGLCINSGCTKPIVEGRLFCKDHLIVTVYDIFKELEEEGNYNENIDLEEVVMELNNLLK